MTDSNNTNEQTIPKKSQKNTIILVVILIALVLIAGGAYLYTKNKPLLNNADSNSGLTLEGDATVAKVNGTEINSVDYNMAITQLANNYTSQGITISEADHDTLKDQAVSALVNKQLIIDAAHDANITPDNSKIEENYQTILESYNNDEKSLTDALAKSGLTKDDLMSDLKDEALIDAYLKNVIGIDNVTVSDEEVANYYDQAKEQAGDTEVPALEEVAELIKNQLLNEKQQTLIEAELAKLKANADIEVLI